MSPTTATSGAGPDPRVDFGWRAAKTPAASVSVGERTTGVPGMTPNLRVNRRGTIFMTVATEEAVLKVPDVLVGKSDAALIRSRDDGRTWTKIKLPKGVIASEGNIYLDKKTDRLYAWSMSYDLTNCGYPVVWTDDEGETWTAAEKRPGCVPVTLGDWPKLFTGPLPAGVQAAPGVTRAVYTCNFVPNILVAASLWCWSSLDGGKTFGNPSMLPALNVACLASDGTTTVHGNGFETIVHGSGQVLKDGTVVVPVTVCGRIVVMRSTDGARTWKVVDTGSDGMGWFNWLSNLATQTGADNVYNMMAQQGIAQDDHGNLFLAYPATGGVRLAYSRDGGLTWKQRGVVSPAAVKTPWLVSTVARGNGEVALAYIATPDKGELVLSGGERFQSWIGYSPDAIREPFAMAPTSSLADPALVSGGIAGQSISCCATLQYFIEFTGIAFVGRDRLRAAFVRLGDEPNPKLVLGKATIDFRDHKVTATANKKKNRPGQKVRITGRVATAASGTQVALQRRVGKTWKTVKRTRLTKTSRYTFKVKPRKIGKHRYRVVAPQSAVVDQGVSKTLTVRVTRKKN